MTHFNNFGVYAIYLPHKFPKLFNKIEKKTQTLDNDGQSTNTSHTKPKEKKQK